jgi:carbamate kinase
MIGYMIEQELGNIIPADDHIVTVLTQVVVDSRDPAFQSPTKPVGPIYARHEAERLAREKNWAIAPDGEYFRRVVPSPEPKRIIEIEAIRLLVEEGMVVICAGGGGIPVAYNGNKLYGVEAVIDKDLASGLLARSLNADMFIMLTDVDYVYTDYGTPQQRAIRAAHPDAIENLSFESGSMGPKVQGACRFVRETGRRSAIGRLRHLTEIVDGHSGTLISNEIDGIQYL